MRPHLEYSATAWSTAAKSHQQSLDKVQNQALRIITGSMRSAPIKAMEEITGIEPLEKRRDVKVLTQAEKFGCMLQHPMNERLQRGNQGRLKRSSFAHKAKELARNAATNSPFAEPFQTSDIGQPWEQMPSTLDIQTEIPGITGQENQNDIIKRSLTLAMIDDIYPQESWIHVYTDGSATNAVANGGAGVSISTPEGNKLEQAIATGYHCTNYAAEIKALEHAADKIKDIQSTYHQVAIYTDAKSVLEALNGDKLPVLRKKLSNGFLRMTLQWIPAHCGVPGNECADKLAKQGAKEPQFDHSVTFQEKKTILKAALRTTQNVNTGDAYHQLERWEQVVILRLRTGHSKLKGHLYKKFKVGESPNCTCGREENPTHVLQACPLYVQAREDTWPTPTQLERKLHGCLQDLKKTASFIKSIGLAL